MSASCSLPTAAMPLSVPCAGVLQGIRELWLGMVVLPRILSERLVSPCLPCRQNTCHMAAESRGKVTSYCITSFLHLFWGDFARTFFFFPKCVSLLPQFPDATAHSCQVGLPQTPEPLPCQEALCGCASPGEWSQAPH